MGKKLRDEDLKLNIIVNGDKAKKELGDLEKSTGDLTSRNKELRAEKTKLERAGKKETDQYKAITREMRENNSAIKANETRMSELRKEIGVTGLTMKQLRSEQTRLKRLLESSTYGTDNWKRYRNELGEVEAQMAKVRNGSKSMRFSMSKLANGVNKYIGLITAAAATLTGIAFSIKEWTQGLIGLDDALADVMKTTGLTRKEVRGLYTDFRFLNTRTPRKELLLLAEEAGRLGIKGTKNIADFVEVANKIKVALGDDLGGESEKAIREVGKLVEVYKVSNQYGTEFKESLEKVGSAINEVSANSNSQAEYQIGFMKRMGGVSQQARISAADVLGYASTLDQLGQSQEMSATAMGKTIISMFKDTAEYAAIAKMEVDDFTKLLNTDANAAFLAVLEGLNGNNEGLSVMAGKLDQLGIDGSRAVQVLAALSSNTKMVHEQQSLANMAMEEGTSLANEYNVKNNNLAGSMDKIGRYIRSKFINSGFLSWMEKVVAKAAEWVEVPIQEKIRKEHLEVNQWVIEMTSANTTAERRNELYTQLNQIAPDVVKNIDLENISVSTLRKNLEMYNEAMIKKLALQDTEDTLQDKREAAGKATGERIEKESQLITEFVSIKQQADRMNKDYADTLQEVILSDDDIIDKTEKINELLEGQRHFYRTNMEVVTNQVVSAREKEKEALDDVNIALEEYSKRYERLFGSGKSGSDTGPKVGSRMLFYNMIYEWDGQKWKVLLPTKQESNPNSTDGSGDSQGSLGLEPEKEDPLGVESWMTSGKWDTYGAEELAARKASEQEWTDFLNNEIQRRVDAEAKALEIEQEIAQARVEINNILVESTGQLASSLAGMFEQGSAWQIAFIAMEKAAGIAKIWINYAKEASAINLAAAEINAVTFGVGGTVWGAAQLAKAKTSAIANTAIIGAQTVASIASSSKREKTRAYAKGKWPGVQTGTYGDQPHYALFNEVPGYPEMVIDGRTFKAMQMDYPGLIDAIYSIRDGKQPGGYANGKYEDGGPNPTQAYTGFDAMIAEMKEHNERTVEEIKKIKIFLSVEEYREADERFTEIQETRGIG